MAGIKKEHVEKVKQIIKDLKEKGLSNVEIAKQYGVSESFVRALSDSTEKTEMVEVTDIFTAEITVCYKIPAGSEMMTAKDYEMFLKSCYDDAHVKKLKHFVQE